MKNNTNVKNKVFNFVAGAFLFLSGNIFSQTYNLPNTGSNTITTCSGNIYDNGGSTGNYVNNTNGFTVINPSTAGNMVRLSGSISTESGWDFVYIYNGAGTSGTLLYSGSGSATIPIITSTSGPLTVRFTSDASIVSSGFNFAIQCVATVPSYAVPSTGSNTITTCSGNLFDNGGSAGNYVNNSNGYTVINPSTAVMLSDLQEVLPLKRDMITYIYIMEPELLVHYFIQDPVAQQFQSLHLPQGR